MPFKSLRNILTLAISIMLLCSCGTKNRITAKMAYEGVSNYCHETYDWSIAKDNPSIMYVQMGKETPTEYQVVFRSYTGAYVHFYVDKKNGTTRMVESMPALGMEEETGTINLADYLKEKPKCCKHKTAGR